jgi:hypothetical protein
MRGELSRQEGGKEGYVPLRTKTVVGRFDFLPQADKPFRIWGKPLTEGATVRLVETSLVIAVYPEKDGIIEFATHNSNYSLQLLDDNEDNEG